MTDVKTNIQDPAKNKNHISSSQLTAFKEKQLSSLDLESFLEHVGSCDFCSNLLADEIEKDLISAPLDMKRNIINKTSKLPSKSLQLFRYSLKVFTASAAAIFLLVTTSKIPYSTDIWTYESAHISVNDLNQPSFTSSIRDRMDQFSNQILEFSNTIINLEVIENDQKEK